MLWVGYTVDHKRRLARASEMWNQIYVSTVLSHSNKAEMKDNNREFSLEKISSKVTTTKNVVIPQLSTVEVHPH